MRRAADVSCIIPVRNAERYLVETLESVFAQTTGLLEILVIDDGSTDGTMAVAQRYANERVRCLTYIGTGGPAGARNMGLAHARGTFVAFLDADDLWHPSKLATQLARFEARPELEVSVAHSENFWSPDVAPADHWFRDDLRPMVIPGYHPGTLLTRAEVFRRFGPWDERRGHASSSEWFARLRKANAVVEMLPDVLMRRRLHATNFSRTGSVASYEDHLAWLKSVMETRRATDRGADANPSVD
jgi:glycosyltransferase involved in cell wall biosynthesis